MKKSVLHRETVRVLDDRSLLAVWGGGRIIEDPDPVPIHIKGKGPIGEDPDPVVGH